MEKFNWKGLGAILIILFGFANIFYDIIKLMLGYSYTVLGVITLFLTLVAMGEAFKYCEDRLK